MGGERDSDRPLEQLVRVPKLAQVLRVDLALRGLRGPKTSLSRTFIPDRHNPRNGGILRTRALQGGIGATDEAKVAGTSSLLGAARIGCLSY